jgi:hypothetical protein
MLIFNKKRPFSTFKKSNLSFSKVFITLSENLPIKTLKIDSEPKKKC